MLCTMLLPCCVTSKPARLQPGDVVHTERCRVVRQIGLPLIHPDFRSVPVCCLPLPHSPPLSPFYSGLARAPRLSWFQLRVEVLVPWVGGRHGRQGRIQRSSRELIANLTNHFAKRAFRSNATTVGSGRGDWIMVRGPLNTSQLFNVFGGYQQLGGFSQKLVYLLFSLFLHCQTSCQFSIIEPAT